MQGRMIEINKEGNEYLKRPYDLADLRAERWFPVWQ